MLSDDSNNIEMDPAVQNHHDDILTEMLFS